MHVLLYGVKDVFGDDLELFVLVLWKQKTGFVNFEMVVGGLCFNAVNVVVGGLGLGSTSVLSDFGGKGKIRFLWML